MNRNLTLALDISGAILFTGIAWLFLEWNFGALFVWAAGAAALAFVVSIYVGLVRVGDAVPAGFVWIGRGFALWSVILFALAFLVWVAS